MLDWLRTLAAAIVGKTEKPGRVDTATRMAMDADFRDSSEPVERIRRVPAPDLDPLEELKRILEGRPWSGPSRPLT
jgi:hypothetical protein